MIEEKVALISSTMLGKEDHGIMTAYLHLDYGGGGQGFGGYALKDKYLDTFITRVLKTAGVGTWEQLKGKYIRVKSEHAKIHAIAPVLGGDFVEWFNPKEVFEAMEAKVAK